MVHLVAVEAATVSPGAAYEIDEPRPVVCQCRKGLPESSPVAQRMNLASAVDRDEVTRVRAVVPHDGTGGHQGLDQDTRRLGFDVREKHQVRVADRPKDAVTVGDE